MSDRPPDHHHPEYVEQTRTFLVPPGQALERIDRYLTQAVMRATRNRVQTAIDAGAVLVNGERTRANYRVRPGDVITITQLRPPPIVLLPQPIPLDIRYEDGEMLFVNKPAGMVTHPGFGNRDGTLVNAVLYHVGAGLLEATGAVVDEENEEESAEDATEEEVLATPDDPTNLPRPGIVHRLDKDTSGLMVVAKNAESHAALARQFAERTAHREYWAVVWGEVEDDSGEIEGNIARDPRDRKRYSVAQRGGKHALTRWVVVERFSGATLLALRLATGRTHQIRVHCAHIGHPLIGDHTYGGRPALWRGSDRRRTTNLLALIDRQALHARLLGLRHPRTREWVEREADPPADMGALIERLRAQTST